MMEGKGGGERKKRVGVWRGGAERRGEMMKNEIKEGEERVR